MIGVEQTTINAGKIECMWFATLGRPHLLDYSPIDLNGTAITTSR